MQGQRNSLNLLNVQSNVIKMDIERNIINLKDAASDHISVCFY